MKPGVKAKPPVYTVVLEPDFKLMERNKEFFFNAYLAKDFRPREHIAGDSSYINLRSKVLNFLNIDKQPKDRIRNEQIQFKIF